MIMGYHGSLSCHLGSFSRTHQNLHHHSLSSSSKSSLHSRYFHLWIWSLHVRVPQFWSLEELHVTAPQEPLQSWQAKNTSSWVISPFCQHVRIASGHQTRQWKKHSFHIFTIFHHTFPRFLLCFIHEWLTGFRWGPDPFSFIYIHLYQQCAPEDFSCAETYLVISCDVQNFLTSQWSQWIKKWDICRTGSFQRFFLLRSTLSAGDSGLIQATTQRWYRTLSKWFEITH